VGLKPHSIGPTGKTGPYARRVDRIDRTAVQVNAAEFRDPVRVFYGQAQKRQ